MTLMALELKSAPEDAFKCSIGINIDILVVENYLLKKEDQDEALKIDYKNVFEID